MATENIPSRLHCVAEGNVLAGANEILDDDKGKKQNVINQENDQRIETLEAAVGTGGSVDSRIESAKTEIVGGASSDCNTLGKAEALISTNANDIAALQEAYAALTQNDVVVVAPSDTWPVATPAQNTIYRVVDRTNTPPQYYTDYMWNGTAMVEMAQYNNAIDPRPKKASQNLVTSGGVFDNMGALDVSELNATENPHTLAKYVDLSAALAAVPTDYQKGGMSIKFVQSSDNKYVQFRLMAPSFSTLVSNWQGVDDVPTVGSDNLVKSGAVYTKSFNDCVDFLGVTEITDWVDGKYIKNIPGYALEVIDAEDWRYIKIQCSKGDKFVISGKGGSFPRLYAFANSNNVALGVASAENSEGEGIEITAPDNAAYLTVNDKNTGLKCYYGGKINIRTIQQDIEKNTRKLISIYSFATSIYGIPAGNIYYNTDTKKLLLVKSGGTVEEIPFEDGAIYTYNGALYVYNGTELKGIKLRGSYTVADDVKEDGFYAMEDKGSGYAIGCLLVQKTGNTIVQQEFSIGVSDTFPSNRYRISTDNGSTWGNWIDWISKASVPYLPKKIMGFGTIGAGNTGVTAVSQFFVNTNNNKLYQCVNYPMASGSDVIEVPFYDGVLYTYNNTIYVYNGNELVGIKMEGSYTNPNDVKSDGWYVSKDRGNGYGSSALLVQKNGNTIVQLQFSIGVSNLQPSIQYRQSSDNGATWGSWIDWVEKAYEPYVTKYIKIYKFLKSLSPTPNGEYYYNVTTHKVYKNNNGVAVEISPRIFDRYEFEGKQYVYSADGLTPLEDALLVISGYNDTTSDYGNNGEYYVVGNKLLYIVQKGLNVVEIPWEKGRPYQYKGSRYYYNGSRLVKEDNTGITIANPPSARCISDTFIGKAACASRIVITDNGIAYVAYMCGNNGQFDGWYEANEKVVLSEFPINRPEMAKNYVIATYDENNNAIPGKLTMPNLLILPNGNIRVVFSNYYQILKSNMKIYYKDFDVENKTVGALHNVQYNGSDISLSVLESIEDLTLSPNDGIHVSGNMMNDFGVDGNDNPIRYFFINAGDGKPVVFSSIDNLETVQLVKVLPISERQYESALCKLGNTFYIYYRASSGSWLTTTEDWETFTEAFQFSTLNNRSDIYCDGTNVYLCGANAEVSNENVFRRTNAHVLVGSGATLSGYEEVQYVSDERGLVELNYLHIGNTHIIVCSSSPIMIDNSDFNARYRGKVGIYFIPIREATPSGLVR